MTGKLHFHSIRDLQAYAVFHGMPKSEYVRRLRPIVRAQVNRNLKVAEERVKREWQEMRVRK